ncbi:MAG: SGNH/GDSL hydrolase family protein [Acidobacteriota bacterium]|nr:SGNH/GDSL hydrolase family protein [Acidobacteriota bacterium]
MPIAIPGQRSLARRLQFRLLAVLIAALLVFGALEVILRTTGGGSREYVSTAVEPEARVPDDKSPDFRRRRPTLDKPSDTYRILLVGDSYAWGYGVEPQDVFAVRLENLISPRIWWAKLEVLNWSRPGWNTVRQKESLDGRLNGLEPDLVLWTFVLNDPEPSSTKQLERLRENLSRREPSGLFGWLHKHSLAGRTVIEAAENLRMKRALDRYYHGLFGEQKGWKLAARALKKMRAELRQRQVPMALVVFPIFDSQLDGRYPYADLHDEVTELAESLDIPALDLLPVFRGVDAKRLAVEPFTDPHPNELAHRIAAQAIFDFLATWKIIQPSKTK